MSKKDQGYVQFLRRKADDSRRDLKSLEEEIALEEGLCAKRPCGHSWGDAIYDPINEGGYFSPPTAFPDEKGYIPYDNLPYSTGVWVAAKTTKRWRRKCSNCGKVEYTTHSREEVSKKDLPVF